LHRGCAIIPATVAGTSGSSPQSESRTGCVSVSPQAHSSCTVRGVDLFRAVCERDREGIVAKWAPLPYRVLGNLTPWLEIRNPHYTQSAGRHEFFSAGADIDRDCTLHGLVHFVLNPNAIDRAFFGWRSGCRVRVSDPNVPGGDREPRLPAHSAGERYGVL
jgi:hypothetical protein